MKELHKSNTTFTILICLGQLMSSLPFFLQGAVSMIFHSPFYLHNNPFWYVKMRDSDLSKKVTQWESWHSEDFYQGLSVLKWSAKHYSTPHHHVCFEQLSSKSIDNQTPLPCGFIQLSREASPYRKIVFNASCNRVLLMSELLWDLISAKLSHKNI